MVLLFPSKIAALVFLWVEIPILLSTVVADSVSVMEQSPCQEGWQQLHGKYCYILQKQQRNWTVASADCKSMGGNLASIHSKEQNDFYAKILEEAGNPVVWIGMKKHNEDDTFEWEDGTIVDYRQWRGGYDSEPSTTIKCVMIYHGFWFPFLCLYREAYLCQKKIATALTKSEEGDERTGSLSSSNVITILVIIFMVMALTGGLLYLKRSWLEENYLKLARVFSRKDKAVNEPSTELILDQNEEDGTSIDKYNTRYAT